MTQEVIVTLKRNSRGRSGRVGDEGSGRGVQWGSGQGGWGAGGVRQMWSKN